VSIVNDFLNNSVSEFEDGYDDPVRPSTENFSAELLEQSVEALNPAKPCCVAQQDPIIEVLAKMKAHDGCVLVVENERLVGIVTETDILRKVVGMKDLDSTPISEVMTHAPEAMSFHDNIALALNLISVGGFRRVPLVDIRLRPVGLISVKDVVDYFVERFPSHVLNVSPTPLVRDPNQRGNAG
jgi:CBS domain-containing protein